MSWHQLGRNEHTSDVKCGKFCFHPQYEQIDGFPTCFIQLIQKGVSQFVVLLYVARKMFFLFFRRKKQQQNFTLFLKTAGPNTFIPVLI